MRNRRTPPASREDLEDLAREIAEDRQLPLEIAREVARAARPALLAWLDELRRWIDEGRDAPPMA